MQNVGGTVGPRSRSSSREDEDWDEVQPPATAAATAAPLPPPMHAIVMEEIEPSAFTPLSHSFGGALSPPPQPQAAAEDVDMDDIMDSPGLGSGRMGLGAGVGLGFGAGERGLESLGGTPVGTPVRNGTPLGFVNGTAPAG